MLDATSHGRENEWNEVLLTVAVISARVPVVAGSAVITGCLFIWTIITVRMGAHWKHRLKEISRCSARSASQGTYFMFMPMWQPILALRPNGEATQNSKQGYRWPQNVSAKIKKTSSYFDTPRRLYHWGLVAYGTICCTGHMNRCSHKPYIQSYRLQIKRN